MSRGSGLSGFVLIRDVFAACSTGTHVTAPPMGWTVTGHVVNIQHRDAKGNWIAHTTIPINAVEAQSTAGYKGFGNGAPPAFFVTPGTWRLNAQAAVPQQSGASEWIEFNVTPHQNIYQDPTQQKNQLPF